MIGAAAVAIACGGSTPGDDGGTDATNDVIQNDVIQSFDAAYGGPPFDAGPADAPSEGTIAAYGGPPQDAGGGG